VIAPEGRRRAAITAALFCALSAIFSWPLITDPLGLQVSRQFDLFSLLWMQSMARPWPGLETAATAWPLGESLARADSFVLLSLARLLDLVDPRLAAPLAALLGPPLSALAAERLAREDLGAAWPWSLIAGMTYGFSGLMATALLEGHVYVMLAPWPPLMASALLRAERQGSARQGALAGIFWGLSLWSSAYLGIAAGLLAAALGLPALRRAESRGPALVAAAVALAAGAAYAALFLSGGELARALSTTSHQSMVLRMTAGSARLGGLAAWDPTADMVIHSITPTLGFTALALTLFSPWLVAGTPAWRRLLAAALIAGALSLGPELQLYHSDLEWPWLLKPLESVAFASFFRHPARLLWATTLAMGGLAAAAATRLARHRPRAALALVGFAAADAVLGTGAPLRTAEVPIESPSAYRAAPEGWAVLELFPLYEGAVEELELYFNNLTCAYQADHRRPLLNRCLGTTLRSGPRWEVSGWLIDAALRGDPPGPLQQRLVELGVGAVALHPGLFPGASRDELIEDFEALFGPPVATSTDAGDWVMLYALAGASGEPPPRAARQAALDHLYAPEGEPDPG
jgi:hypothetical protein